MDFVQAVKQTKRSLHLSRADLEAGQTACDFIQDILFSILELDTEAQPPALDQ